MKDPLINFETDEFEKYIEAYSKEYELLREAAIKSLIALGVCSYYDEKTMTDIKEKVDIEKELRRKLTVVNAKYASLKYSYYEVIKELEICKNQLSHLAQQNHKQR